MSYDQLFEPIDVGGATIPNRIVRAAHSTGSPWVDSSDDLLAYHEARARGGVGLSILEIAGVHRSSPSTIPIYSDRVRPGLARLAEVAHRHGMVMFQQLWHGGSAAVVNGLGGARWSASEIPNPMISTVPVAMTKAMIDEIVAAFAVAARRVAESGLDGVEIHGAHGYLVGQFLSPLTNRREDDYGGSAEHRVRFLHEIVAAVRAEVGKDFPVGVRLSSDEEVVGGLVPRDTAHIVELLGSSVDFVDVSAGSYYRLSKITAPMDEPLGYQLPKSREVTRVAKVPTIVTGRIMTLDHAAAIVASGEADLVSMVRALIADPDLVTKARTGRDEEIRPCISSNQGCVAGLLGNGKMRCVVNVAAGAELALSSDVPPPAEIRRRIVVVGGGPAGLEAARTARLRGHEVILMEMTGRLGGQVNMAAAAPHRADFGAVTQWLVAELGRLGVEVCLRTPAAPDTIMERTPDVVIVATGSTPRRDGFQTVRPARAVDGVGQAHVHTSWDVFGFGGRATTGTTAVVYDDAGGHEALAVTEQLVAAGTTVTFVSRYATLGARIPVPEATIQPTLERLRSAPVEVIGDAYLERIGADTVDIAKVGSDVRLRRPAELVVNVGLNRPNRELADALDGSGAEVYLVGDAAGGQSLQHAISDGHLTARKV